MNFSTNNWSELVNNGPSHYWEISIPSTILVMMFLMYPYITRLAGTARRQVVRRGVKIELHKSREMRRHRGTGAISRRAADVSKSSQVR